MAPTHPERRSRLVADQERGGNLSFNLKPRNLFVPSLTVGLLLAVAMLPSIEALGGRADIAFRFRPPDEEDAIQKEKMAYELDPTPNLVDVRPNEDCDSASEWDSQSRGHSKGKLETEDVADWSRVLVLRTENLAASVDKETVKVEAAKSCGDNLVHPAEVASTKNGWVPLRVTLTVAGSDPFEAYHLDYMILANDAGSGTDISNNWSAARPLHAMPEGDPFPTLQKGALPNRGDELLGPDVDWFRISTGFAQVPDVEDVGAQNLSLGLLTVYFSPDCYAGEPEFTLLQADAMTPIGLPEAGCGIMLKSCIAASFSGVYARLKAPSTTGGAAYDLAATLAPLALVGLSHVEITTLDPEQPWCDPLTPTILSAAAGASGEPWGVMDNHGHVVAKVNNGRP